ncbi:MAG: hypothetical protein WC456_01425 [Patescibacteria group bacterium]
MKDLNLFKNFDGWPQERKPDDREKEEIKEEAMAADHDEIRDQEKLRDDPDEGHLAAEKALAAKQFQDLLDKQARQEEEEVRKNMEEDREEMEKTYRRFR